MGWVSIVLSALVAIGKAIFGTSTPRKTTVEHAKQEVPIDDGKTDSQRLDDLGL